MASTTVDNFDAKYAEQGGVAKLIELYKRGLSSPEIGKVFGLQGKQVDYYLKRIVSDNYIAYPWRKAMYELGLDVTKAPRRSTHDQ